jgi:hypothetical protein
MATGAEAKLAPAVVGDADSRTFHRNLVTRAMTVLAYRATQGTGRPGLLALQGTLDNFATRLTLDIDS